MNIDSFLELCKKRRSIRLLKPDPIPEEDLMKILEAGRWAMSGANGQPWEFVVVTDKATKAKIGQIINDRQERHREVELTRLEELRHRGYSDGRSGDSQVRLVNSAYAIIVVCGDPRTFQASVLGNQFFSGEWDIFHMNLANATMSIQLATAALGLGSAWLTVDRPADFDLKLLLGIPKEYRSYVIVPIGRRAYEPPPSYRRGLDEIVHRDKYDQSKYRTHAQIREWLAELRKRVSATYDPSLRGPKSS